MKHKIYALLLCLAAIGLLSGCGGSQRDTILHWTADSPTMASIVSFVADVTDEKSESFVPEDRRIAVFDMDEKASSFAETCRALGFETVSMRDEFETIYAEGVTKTEFAADKAA